MAGFLDRPLDDLPVLLALTDVAREAIRAANERMRDG